MKAILKQINPFNNKKCDNKILYIIKYLLKTFIVYFVSLIAAETIIIGITMLFGYNATDNQLPQNISLLVAFYGYIFTIIAFLLFNKKIDKSTLKSIGVDKNFKTLFKGVLIGLISLTIIIGIMLLTNIIKFNGINSNVNYLFIVLFFFGYLIQSTMEELICRGYLLHKLKKELSIIISVLISFAFFSVNHFSKLFDSGFVIGLIGCVNLLLITISWSLLTLKDKNIYSAIGFHFIWNFTLYNIIGLNLSGLDASDSLFSMSVNNNFLTGASYGIESSIITTAILLVIFLSLLYKYYKNKKVS